MNPYIYNSDNIQFNLNIKKTSANWSRYSVDFASAYNTPFAEINMARGYYLQPHRAEKVPLVILLHGVGDHSVIPCRMLAGNLVRQGIACFILYQPFHSSRMTKDMKRRFPTLSAGEWFEHYRVSVINVRQVLDWAKHRSEIDTQRMALFGISLGGFISAITMGIDQRVKASVLTVMGGNSAKISQLSPRWARRGFNKTEEEYRRFQEVYHAYLDDVVQKGFEGATPPEESFLTDPLTFSPFLKERPVYMVNALWDEAIPRAATIDFWEACGKPPITWLPATHASIWIWYPLIRMKVSRFLQGVFSKGS